MLDTDPGEMNADPQPCGIQEGKNSYPGPQHCSGGRFSLQILEQELLEKRVKNTKQ
jgi:hypothetical protein